MTGDAWRIFRSNRYAVFAALFLLLIMVMVIAPGLLAPHDPEHQNLLDGFTSPGREFWLGTDDYGRDQLSRLIYGTRVSVGAAAIAVVVGLVLGVPAGLVAGYAGGKVDTVLSAVFDGIMSIPGVVLAIAMVAALGPGVVNAMLAVGIIFAPRFFRVQRGTTIALRQETFVEACEAIGCSRPRIVLRHIVPNTLSPTLVQVSICFAAAVIAEASLSFIGLGAQLPTASWGTMLSDAYRLLDRAPYLLFPAGAMIILTVLCLTWLGDAVRDIVARTGAPDR